MSLSKIIHRLQTRIRRDASHYLGRRDFDLRSTQPIISFTFDDFPRTALHQGGCILKRYGHHGTYYVALGLMDTEIPAGRAFSREDLLQVVADGHELGCHTYAHCHAWDCAPYVFEENIIENQRKLRMLLPGAEFKSLSYPIAWPRPATKRRVAKHFQCARSSGPSFNLGRTDANNLRATFIEKHRDNPAVMFRLIEENQRAGGWLIFATHDVTQNPSFFGCEPSLFEELVRLATNSGARILPLASAWKLVQANSSLRLQWV